MKCVWRQARRSHFITYHCFAWVNPNIRASECIRFEIGKQVLACFQFKNLGLCSQSFHLRNLRNLRINTFLSFLIICGLRLVFRKIILPMEIFLPMGHEPVPGLLQSFT